MVSRDVTLDSLASVFGLSRMRPFGFVPFTDVHELKPGYAGTVSPIQLELTEI